MKGSPLFDVFPKEIVYKIYKYIPKSKPKQMYNGLEKQVMRIRNSPKATPMWLYGLEDFVLV